MRGRKQIEMKELIGIYIIFGILFLLEKKNINKLANYIGLVLILAIILSLINVHYFSYILILVQISALTILFGFILMLYSDQNSIKINEKNLWINIIKYIILYFLILFIILFFYNSFSLIDFSLIFSKFSINLLPEKINLLFNNDIIEEMNESLIIPNLSLLLFNEYLINLLVITILLLFAIIALFFAINL